MRQEKRRIVGIFLLLRLKEHLHWSIFLAVKVSAGTSVAVMVSFLACDRECDGWQAVLACSSQPREVTQSLAFLCYGAVGRWNWASLHSSKSDWTRMVSGLTGAVSNPLHTSSYSCLMLQCASSKIRETIDLSRTVREYVYWLPWMWYLPCVLAYRKLRG